MNSELDRFLHRVIHALAARNALREHDSERRLAVDYARFPDRERHCRLAHPLYASWVFVAAAVENGQRIPSSEAQHVRDVMRGLW